jgi:hypothetical protein
MRTEDTEGFGVDDDATRDMVSFHEAAPWVCRSCAFVLPIMVPFVLLPALSLGDEGLPHIVLHSMILQGVNWQRSDGHGPNESIHKKLLLLVAESYAIKVNVFASEDLLVAPTPKLSTREEVSPWCVTVADNHVTGLKEDPDQCGCDDSIANQVLFALKRVLQFPFKDLQQVVNMLFGG